MKASQRKLGLTLAGMMTLSSVLSLGLGISPARADDDWFRSVRRNCERVDEGYLCRKSDRNDRFGQSRRSNGRFGRIDRTSRNRNGRFGIRSGELYKGSVIQTRAYSNNRIEIRRGDSRNLTLVVDRNVYSDDTNQLLIPKGSRIEGRLRASRSGARYEADRLILTNGRRYNLNARSETIGSSRSRRSSNSGLSSSASRVILGSVLGQDLGGVISNGNVLSGSGSRSRDRIIRVNPKRDLDLQLTRDLRIN